MVTDDSKDDDCFIGRILEGRVSIGLVQYPKPVFLSITRTIFVRLPELLPWEAS